ncbi:MAG: SDR family NAD(P)-dependent oxidoreductase [Erysipelotrichia bacterium]|nr:SDR family NAD(P)-dependent oxidoreductase [Erysipelotrichia bacterium]
METVLITGGSEGIGYELARCYARAGFHVILAARTKDKLVHACRRLEKEFKVQTDNVCCDLSLPGSALQLYQNVKQRAEVNVLINNAGFGSAGYAEEISIERDEAMIQLNDASMVTLSKLFARDMKKQGSGTIINIGSTGAFQPGPYIAGYYASKSFTVSYSRALARELKDTGIKVLCPCPGPVNTAFYAKSNGIRPSGAASAEETARWIYIHRSSSKTVLIQGAVNHLAMLVPSEIRMRIVESMKLKNMEKKK